VDAPCQYPNCREIVTTIVVIEREYAPITRRVCDAHVGQAQAIAEQHGGIAYRLRPI
jgi:hypothetical protein